MNTPRLPIIAVIDHNTDRYAFVSRLGDEGDVHVIMLNDARAAPAAISRLNCAVWLVDSRLADIRGIDCIEMLVQLYPQAHYYLIADEYDADEERLCFRFRHVKYLCRPLDVRGLGRLLKSHVTRQTDPAAEMPPARCPAEAESAGSAHEHRGPPRGLPP